jgi:hypothetical protein
MLTFFYETSNVLEKKTGKSDGELNGKCSNLKLPSTLRLLLLTLICRQYFQGTECLIFYASSFIQKVGDTKALISKKELISIYSILVCFIHYNFYCFKREKQSKK